ncbi:MAG: bifunctional ornithine acetyltransferase/N-acetylglutamate synthase, partial [Syntrophomonas sp.]
MKFIEGSITAPQGFLATGVAAEIKYKDKKDVAIIFSQIECNAAAVYTINKVHAACIDLCRDHLQDGRVQAVVVNSGNANACTGRQGMEDCKAMANLTAAHLGIKGDKVLVASTGVIGVFMPMDKIMAGIEMASAGLSEDGGHAAAQAIMTTDLVSKEVVVELKIGGHMIRVAGMAKGSGMIHPNMATMLAFITTDAHVCSHSLQKMLKSAVDRSFNMISVDRDTSTNDMALI